MPSLALGIGVWLIGVASVASHDGPFYPTANVPDHVVTLVERSIHARESAARIVYSHGDWTRVDVKAGGGGTRSNFWQRDCKVNVQLFRDHKDEIRTLAIRRGCQESPIYDHNAIKTDERQLVAGEHCTVWSTRRSKPSDDIGLNYTNCITEDGIELWYKAIGSRGALISSAEATAVQRRPVAPAEAYPPADLLKIDGWFAEAANQPGPGRPDFEIVMQGDGGSATTRTIRQRGHWIHENESSGGVLTSVSVRNPARGLEVWVSRPDTEKPVLGLSTRSQAVLDQIASAAPPDSMRPRPLGRHETILGEHCEWFDMMPGMMDGSHSACRTADGITLKNLWGRRGQANLTDVAVQLTRRPVALDEIKLPVGLLDPKFWGLPE